MSKRKVYAVSVVARKWDSLKKKTLSFYLTTWMVAHSRDEAIAVKKRQVIEDPDSEPDDTWKFNCQGVEIPLELAIDFVADDDLFDEKKAYFGYEN
jgi:hypothetical protein